jgi:hypothetical protein
VDTAQVHKDRPSLWPAILVVVLFALALLGFILLVARRNDMPLVSLTQDPAITTGVRWQTGFLYKIGILVWGAIVGSCLLGAMIWRRSGGAGRLAAFLFTSAAVTLILALDDAFQLRFEIFDHLRVPEVGVFALYAVVVCAIAVIFARTLARTEYVVLIAAVVLFVAWLVLRQAGFGRAPDDFVRLVAQLTLLLYFLRTGAYGLTAPR